MERKIISHRIGSILDDISRLSNALYAMDTTDIQRYPDNYEVLSTDAALRAEKIACRLRHLIYSSTTICKGDYLTSAGIVHGIEVVYEDGVLEVTLPGLLPKRKQRQNTEFLLDPFYFSLEQYAKEHPMPHFSDCVVCFTQVYDQCLSTRRIRDYDNLEEKQLLDVLSTFVMADDTGLLCDAYNTAALGSHFFRLNGHRAFDGLGGSDGELVAVHGEIQPGGAAGEGVVAQHTVGIRESEGILLAIPFQLIGTGVCGAAEKAGEHSVALDRALNGGILAENLAV